MQNILKSITFIGASLLAQVAVAQATYQYTGNSFTLFSCGPNASDTATMDCPNDPAPANPLTSYTATDHVTATLTFTSPLTANLNYADVTGLPGFVLSMNDGHQTLSTATSSAVIAKVSTNGSGQIIGPWLLVINAANAADSGIASENEPPIQPFVQDGGTLACCDPTLSGDIAINQNNPGTWGSGSASPAQQVTDLITLVQQMKIPAQGSSLTDQLQQVAADISAQNGKACGDLSSFASHVKAQTGKKITAAQAKQIQAAVASIASALKCGA